MPLLGGLAGYEVIVVDGGSSDRTCEVAKNYGAKLYVSSPGRGGQLALGAQKSKGNWLFFLHADSCLPEGWQELLERHRRDQPQKALCFSLKLDDDRWQARGLEYIVRLRCRFLVLPYGDQGLFISRRLYEEAGGFADMPLMEDVDLVRRLGRRRIAISPAAITTSAVRYRKAGYIRRMTRNMLCLTLYFLGMPPERIVQIYHKNST